MDAAPQADPREEFVGRLFMASLGAFEVMTVYVGGKLGLYQSLHDDGPATPAELAARTHIAERYAQEWLEQQAAADIITVDDVSKPAMERRYTLPDGYAEALLDRESPYSIEPLVRFIGPMTAALPTLLNAYRTGGGVSWGDFGPEATEAQGDFNRPWLLSDFGSSYLPSVPDLHERLSAGARIADVACGVGWASIALAKAYPNVTVDGFDLDDYSIQLARKNGAEAGVADRVTFEARDAADPAYAGKYDFAVIVEALHDMSNPVGALRAVEKMLKPDGVALIVDERVQDTFTAPADETDRFMYAVSFLVCLPAGLADTPSAGTGTVIRSSTLTRYANEAGFSKVEVLDQIEHPFLRFYRLER